MRVIDYLGEPKRRWNVWLRDSMFIKVATGEARKLIAVLSATLLFTPAHIDDDGDIIVNAVDIEL